MTLVLLAALVGTGLYLLTRWRSGGAETPFGGQGSPIVNPTVTELAQSTVQILGLSGDGEPVCSGSGTFVSVDGMILTNAHVVTREPACDFASLGIAVTTDSGRPPELLYEAELLAVDADTDLAVIKVTRPTDPSHSLPSSFPALAVGDSDGVEIGDDLRILGYPEIGGDTITFTNGSVSGFTAQVGIGDRALIKTDATIAGGNSGGAAIDSEGRLIGIPTKARASENGPAVDCRPLADTNGDGAVDNSDNCVPIGGFLNGIRPINLALPLIEQAKAAAPQPLQPAAPAVEVDLSGVAMTRPRFSLGESGDAPTGIVRTATSGITELCLFVDWAGIPNGAEWDGYWYRDQDLIDEYSLIEQSWEFGEQGTDFWMCAIDEQDGLAAGLYELGFFLDGELVFAEGIVLTDQPVPVLTTEWENLTGVDVCALAVNPKGSGPVGLNELAPGESIPPGGIATLELPAGEVVVKAYDCNGQALADSGAGSLAISEEDTYFGIEVPS
jgi:S1-C subfamily serine protease